MNSAYIASPVAQVHGAVGLNLVSFSVVNWKVVPLVPNRNLNARAPVEVSNRPPVPSGRPVLAITVPGRENDGVPTLVSVDPTTVPALESAHEGRGRDGRCRRQLT